MENALDNSPHVGPLRIEDLLNPSLLAELRRLEFKTRRALDADLVGEYRSAFRGSGLVFSDVREYQPGDEVKNIHWKATARTNKVYVKSYQEDRSLRIMLAVDISRSTACGSPRSAHAKAFEFAALIGMLAQQNEDALGLCLFSDEVEEYFPPQRSRTQFQRILLRLLAQRSLKPATNIAPALNHIALQQRKRSIVFVISDFFAPAFERELFRLSRHHEVICCLLEDPLQYSLPAVGLVEFVDAESGSRIVCDTSRRHGQEMLHRMHESRIKALELVCTSCQADFLGVKDKPLQPLAALMRRRIGRRHSLAAS